MGNLNSEIASSKFDSNTSVSNIEQAATREDVLVALVRGADRLLEQVRLYSVGKDKLQGRLALDGDKLETSQISKVTLSLRALSVIPRSALGGIPYVGPMPDTDPGVELCDRRLSKERGLVVMPIHVGTKVACVVVGHPRTRASRDLRDAVAHLGAAATNALGRLLLPENHGGSDVKVVNVAVGEGGQFAAVGAKEGDLQQGYKVAFPGIGNQAAGRPSSATTAPPPRAPQPITPGTTPAAVGGPPPIPMEAAGGVKKGVSATMPPPQQTAPPPAPPLPPQVPKKKVQASSPPKDLTQMKDPSEGPTAASDSPQTRQTGSTPQSVDEDNRREHPRFPLTIEVSHTSSHNFFTGFMEDLSEGGLFVSTYAHVEIGDELELEFTMPGVAGGTVVQCEVRWVREYNPGNADCIPGMGLRFKNLNEETTIAIQRFLKQRDPIFYDD